MPTATNLLTEIPATFLNELTDSLLNTPSVRIERIVSHGHTSPQGCWYDQDEHEWVVVLKGSAKLLFEGEEEPLEMGTGDYINIPAHKKHRVEWTTEDEPTIWLAVFYG